MKKIYTLAVAAVFTTASFAQVSQDGNAYIKETKALNVKHNNSKTPTDTAGWVPNASKWVPGEFAAGNQVVNFGYTGGGYIFGTNISTNEISECAQGYLNLTAATFGVEGVLFSAHAKDYAGTTTGTSTGTVNVYGWGTNTCYSYDGSNFNQDTDGPTGSALGTASFTLSAVDTSWFPAHYVAFSAPVAINGTNFAVSVDATGIKSASDTLGILCDQDGEGFGIAFHNAGTNGNWYQTATFFNGPADVNVAIFPVIDDNFVGIDDVDFFNGMQLSAFPNPVVDQTTVSYNLAEDMDNVRLSIHDMTGKHVHDVNYGNQTKGSYNVTIDASNFTAGNYFYTLFANGQRLTKRMVVTK
jgi:hypothetical protein